MLLKGHGWPLILGCLSFMCAAIENVTVLEVSRTQKSIMIDRGAEIDHLKANQQGSFYLQESADIPHMTFVAKGEAVKVHSNFSYWYLTSIGNSEYLKKGQKLEFISETDMLTGRRPIDVREQTVVLSPDQSIENLESQNKKGVPERFIKRKDDYQENDENVQTKIPHHEDVLEKNYGKWDELSSQTGAHFESEVQARKSNALDLNDKNANKKSTARLFEKETYDSTTAGVIHKLNSQSDPLEAIYGRSSKNEGNVYNSFQKSQTQIHDIDENDFKKINTEDPRWSQDMTDKQLRHFFVESSIESEMNRQRFALESAPNNEVLFRYVMGTKNKTSSDENSNQGTAQAIDTSYEFHLVRAHSLLRDWTLEGGYSWGYNFYNADPYNARASEQVYHLGFNYYFFNGPATINSFLLYAGLGMRHGAAQLISENFLNEYGYQLRAFYTQWGMKYRFSGGDFSKDLFRVGFGLNALMSTEKVILNSNQPLPQYDVSGHIVATDIKFLVGMSLFF